MPCKTQLLVLAMIGGWLAGGVNAQAENRKLEKVQVFPSELQLTTDRDRQSLVVQGIYSDGTTRDLTPEAKITLGKPLARLDGATLYPTANGKTEVNVEVAGKKLQVPLSVADAEVHPPISFRLDVMPIFMKSGCNVGSCHGSSRGQDGFRLSLFGFDPAGDYYRLTREMPGRRINLGLPSESLLLEKSIGEVSHSGGERFTSDSELYSTMLEWIEAGAPDDEEGVAVPVSLQVLPQQIVLVGEGATQQITVRATYSDGTDRDVTSQALYMTNRETTANIDDFGLVTAGVRGEAHVFARFATFTVGAEVLVLPDNDKFQWPQVEEFNEIDGFVHDKLQKLHIEPADVCSDEVFLRRAYLDLIGVPPTPEQFYAFMADNSQDKRERLVDELLERPEFVNLWATKWSELLQVVTVNNKRDQKETFAYNRWIREQLAAGRPLDEFVRDLITANGSTFHDAPANFYAFERTPTITAENVAQVFLGMRIQCAQCHNHPFDRWTMDDYYGFSSFFAGILRKNLPDYRERLIYHRSGVATVRHPVSGQQMEPKFLGAETPKIESPDPRVELAEWLTAPDNDAFTENLANIIWAHFFGRGIIDEVDDVRVSNPPSNSQLLSYLGDKLAEYDFDYKKLIRDICVSRSYQLSTKTNETNASDDTNFSHAGIRRLRAEVLLDSISHVTETTDAFGQVERGTKATELPDGRISNYFLQTFGRSTRESVCSCEVSMEPNLSQALHLLNGDTVNNKIRGSAIIRDALAAKQTPEQVLEDLYIRCYTRKPTEKELEALRPVLADASDAAAQREVLEDILWSLMNSKEFVFNH